MKSNSSTQNNINMNTLHNLLEKLQKFAAESKHSSDRALAVLGATYLSDLLGHLLAAFMIAEDKITTALLGSERPLGTFGARIVAAYALGLLSPNEYHDLLHILKIRNAFVDEYDTMNFSHERVRQHCFALRALREITRPEESLTPRRMYEFVIPILARQLALRTAQAEREKRQPPGNFKAIDTDVG